MPTMKDLAALLGVELGEEFRISDSQWLYKFNDNGLMYKENGKWGAYETTSMLCGLFTGKREMVKLPWKPRKGDKYWYVDVDGTPDFNTFSDDDVFALEHYACKNCFRTENEAKANINEVTSRLKAIYENGREEQKSEKPSVVEATRALKEYCTGRECSYCKFCVDKENGEGCWLEDTPSIWPI